MLTTHRTQRITFVLLGFLWLAAGRAQGTTFVMMDEPTLMATSDIVITGTVTSITSATSGPTSAIATYVQVQVDRVIKGQVDGDTIVAREPGGSVGDRRQWIFGAPEFWVGERTLLFLSRNPDGTLQTNSLGMGKFTLAVDREGHTTAVRDFGEGASVFVPETGQLANAEPETQPFAPLLHRLRELANGPSGVARRPSLRVAAPDMTASTTEAHESYTFLGTPSRWFQPDSNQPVTYLLDSTGDSRLGFASSQAALDAAFAAWTNVPTSNLILADGGTTSAGQFGPCDINRITFNDPFNEITDPSGCSGTLAIGGFCTGGGSTVVNGTTFRQITTGKITFNNGWGACSFWTQCNMAEVATHELGHTIGLGHSGDGTATMAAVAHFDGRCAGLRSDDIAAVSFIYPQIGTPPPTSTSLPGATPTPTVPAPVGGPANDGCASAVAISDTTYSSSTTTTAATIDSADPSVACGNGSRAKSVWYRFTAPSAGTLTANTFGSNYDTVLATYTGACGAFTAVPGACNDDSGGAQSRVSFTASGGTTYYFLVSAYSSNGGSLVFQLTFQGVGATATPTITSPPATPTRTSTPAPPTATRTQTPSPTMTFTSGPPTQTFTPRPPTATFTITPTFTVTPPATPTSSSGLSNDACSGAMVVNAAPFSYSLATVSATSDVTDPAPGCGNHSRSRSVWYRFTAPSAGTLSANTFGSNYDTILSAYTGTCGSYTPVAGACNDDTGGAQSSVSLAATSGVTYYFLASSYNATGGTLVFQLSFQGTGPTAAPTSTFTPAAPTATRTRTPSPTVTLTPGPPTATFSPGPPTATPTQTSPPTPTSPGGGSNDACANALAIPAVPYAGTATTTTATTEDADPTPTCGNHSRSKSAWYRFTAPSSGTLTADTFGSSYDTILSVYTGSCGAFTAVTNGCNDDSGSVQSRVSFPATAGSTYYFLATAYAGNGGTLHFDLTY